MRLTPFQRSINYGLHERDARGQHGDLMAKKTGHSFVRCLLVRGLRRPGVAARDLSLYLGSTHLVGPALDRRTNEHPRTQGIYLMQERSRCTGRDVESIELRHGLPRSSSASLSLSIMYSRCRRPSISYALLSRASAASSASWTTLSGAAGCSWLTWSATASTRQSWQSLG